LLAFLVVDVVIALIKRRKTNPNTSTGPRPLS
jgi:hypothetical protein